MTSTLIYPSVTAITKTTAIITTVIIIFKMGILDSFLVAKFNTATACSVDSWVFSYLKLIEAKALQQHHHNSAELTKLKAVAVIDYCWIYYPFIIIIAVTALITVLAIEIKSCKIHFFWITDALTKSFEIFFAKAFCLIFASLS